MSAMENVDKFESNPAYKKLLKEAKGIGTGATRGGIIDLLHRREYITINKGVIAPTQYGEDIVSYIPEELYSPALTAVMEGELNEIMQGTLRKEDMLQRVADSMPERLKAIDDIVL